MALGLSTPLLDFFRRGEVARDVRLLAAQGALAPRPLEQLGLLMLLVDDSDPAIAAAAESTLKAIPAGSMPRSMKNFRISAGTSVLPRNAASDSRGIAASVASAARAISGS